MWAAIGVIFGVLHGPRSGSNNVSEDAAAWSSPRRVSPAPAKEQSGAARDGGVPGPSCGRWSSRGPARLVSAPYVPPQPCQRWTGRGAQAALTASGTREMRPVARTPHSA